MDKEALTAKILEVFSDVLPEIDANKLDLTAPLTTTYGVNSVSIIQFIVGLEKEFNIEFDDSELALGLYYDMNDMIKAVQAKI
jgi:acyl carrier protein